MKYSEVAFPPFNRNIYNGAMSVVMHDMNIPSCDSTLRQNLPLKKKYWYFKGTVLTSAVIYIGRLSSKCRKQWMLLSALAAL